MFCVWVFFFLLPPNPTFLNLMFTVVFLFPQKHTKNPNYSPLDDPTIMSWNLVNEPRCEGPADCGMQGWITEMAGAMKRADGNHLVTVGADGFYAAAR